MHKPTPSLRRVSDVETFAYADTNIGCAKHRYTQGPKLSGEDLEAYLNSNSRIAMLEAVAVDQIVTISISQSGLKTKSKLRKFGCPEKLLLRHWSEGGTPNALVKGEGVVCLHHPLSLNKTVGSDSA